MFLVARQCEIVFVVCNSVICAFERLDDQAGEV